MCRSTLLAGSGKSNKETAGGSLGNKKNNKKENARAVALDMLAITTWLRKQRTFQGHFQPLQEAVLSETQNCACHALSHYSWQTCLFYPLLF